MKASKALICGISGQDGAFLAQLLLGKGYEVYGTSRGVPGQLNRLEQLGIASRVKIEFMNLLNPTEVHAAIDRIRPDEIYNLSAQSSVGLSFQLPVETIHSISSATLNLLEVVRGLRYPCRLYSAGSSECFGDTGGLAAHEGTPFGPRSPYAVGKCAAFWKVANYREAFGLYACTGITFNHESQFRSAQFVTRKIVSAAVRIAQGGEEKLALGNLSIRRDWGWAPEYVEAMWLMLQQDKPDDFVIATGETNTLEDFVATAFRCVNLEWRDHVVQSKDLMRAGDFAESRGNPIKAHSRLGWQARYRMADVVRKMIEAELHTTEPDPLTLSIRVEPVRQGKVTGVERRVRGKLLERR